HTVATSAAAKPSTVTTGTAGSASTFAGIATRLIRPEMAAITGAVTRCAAVATARDSASTGGTCHLRNVASQPGAINSRAAVANADIANPGSVANNGSHTSNASTVAARAGTACLGRPDARDTNATAAIKAARKTLGDGRATRTNPTRTSAPT